MTFRNLYSTVFMIAFQLSFVALASAQMTEQAAREQARSTVWAELHSTLQFKSDQFLDVERDEELEHSLAVAVGARAGLRFIYRVSPTGYEIRENTVVDHIWTDVDVSFIVAINPADGTAYRLHGYASSLPEFEKLIATVGMKVSSPEQAEFIADFYRKVNPENLPVTPILSLLDLKQTAERQCQRGLDSFDADQKAFTTWWNRAKPLYAEVSFKQTVASLSGDYFVEWIVLSSAAEGNCGGAPLRARLDVASDGNIGKITFSTVRKP